MPDRVQLRRTKGWRLPAGAVVVSRPSRFGNPWRVKKQGGEWLIKREGNDQSVSCADEATAHRRAVELYREHLWNDDELRRRVVDELAGHDLACWCRPGLACHATVLLEMANSRT
jgi:hypothetical protein